MKRGLRRVIFTVVGLSLALVGLAAIENFTAQRRFDEFVRRTVRIHEGMTEADVRAVAGPPDQVVSDLGSKTDPSALAASCRDVNGVAALLYSVEYLGWIGHHLGASPSSIQTDVVCLNERRIVVNRYVQLIHF